MQCERCGALMALGEEKAYSDRFLCEKCFMDVLAPSGICNTAIQRGICTSRQHRILAAINDNDGITLEDLAARLDLPASTVEDELLVLVRMEKVRDDRKGGKKIYRICCIE
ncbi:MAG: ArsR family transcriptional regulator [Desulfobulbaceae bacterium]|nr:ArsR family transcriptional regulator [Desulfobulbaceae bacterium]